MILRILVLALLFASLMAVSGCDVECNDGTVHERHGKGNVVCQKHGGEKIKRGW